MLCGRPWLLWRLALPRQHQAAESRPLLRGENAPIEAPERSFCLLLQEAPAASICKLISVHVRGFGPGISVAALVLEGGHDYLKLIRGSLSFPFPSTPGLTLTLSLLARVAQGYPRNEASSTVGLIEDIGATDGEKLLPRPGGSVVPNLELPLVQIAQAGVGRNANEPALVPLRGGGLGCSESISGGRCTRCRRAAPAAWGAWRPPSGLESGAWAFRERDDWTRLRTSHKGGSVHSFAGLPSPLPWYPLPPLSGYPFCPGAGVPPHRPPPSSRRSLTLALGDPLPVSLSQASQGRLGQRGRTGCGARVILPLGTACVCHPTSAPRGACLPCHHQLPTSLGLQSWRSGRLKDHRTQS